MKTNQYKGTERISEKVIITNNELLLHESIVRALVPKQSSAPNYFSAMG
ncbi:hypothetical protein [Cellulophaga sp. HaHa_2_1]|nr:hypothetical protein [Cellulophaga sp. HaHa_2_1]QXP53825.1 hypothetical protein H0I24_07805 [Cellulophaga sp. HaHa_2_1]